MTKSHPIQPLRLGLTLSLTSSTLRQADSFRGCGITGESTPCHRPCQPSASLPSLPGRLSRQLSSAVFFTQQRHHLILVWDPGKSEHEVQEASPERCRAIYTASRSFSESPKKRSWIDIDRQREEDNRRPKEGEWAREWSSSDEWDGDSGYQDSIWPPGEASSETEVEVQP